MQSPKAWIAAVGFAAGVALFTSPAAAVVLVTDCTATCSSNCELQSDLSCNGKNGITLNSGADLEMAGHTLSCTSNCPAAAVTIGASGSIVHNDAGNAVGVEGGIDGSFTVGVNCASKSGSTVRGIRVENVGYVGTENCAKVQDSILIGPGTAWTGAIYTTGVSNTDYIRNNYIENWDIGISVGGSNDNEIANNQIVVRDVGSGVYEAGISLSPGWSGTITIADNAFYGNPTGGELLRFSGAPTLAGNRCDGDTTACTSCRSVLRCSSPTTPFN
jgi:hypothetical protein